VLRDHAIFVFDAGLEAADLRGERAGRRAALQGRIDPGQLRRIELLDALATPVLEAHLGGARSTEILDLAP